MLILIANDKHKQKKLLLLFIIDKYIYFLNHVNANTKIVFGTINSNYQWINTLNRKL